MANLFNQVQLRRPRLNKFNLSHERKMSLQMGVLTPFLLQEIVPGDAFRVNTEIFLRMAPMLAPIMHRVNVYTHYFFVPNRLVWSEWEDFITGGEDGTSAPVAPYIQILDGIKNYFDVGTLADYLGLPVLDQGVAVTQSINVSSLPFRGYTLIRNEYYRDQNLQAAAPFSKGSGAEVIGDIGQICALRGRCWEKDYFTSALPWAQRGPEVLMPIEGEGVVNYKNTDGNFFNSDNTPIAVGGTMEIIPTVGDGAFGRSAGEPTKSIYVRNIDSVDFTNTTVTINELRRTIKLQEWLEKNARGGARYTEQIYSHFGVKSSDARLQRPEYLGGGRVPVSISEVVSTFQDGTGEPQGNMSGHGVSIGNSNGFKRRFEEHGYVFGIMSVLPRTAYQQGVPRHFSRFDKFDYYWPEFAHIGEQQILNKEIYFDGQPVPNGYDGAFGYTPRYSEYKYGCSSVHGEFRDSLSFWHMGRIFASAPALDSGFVVSDPTTRIFAVPTEPQHLYCHLYNRVDALRPMPYFGTPSI